MIRTLQYSLALLGAFALTGCSTQGVGYPGYVYQPIPGQGQYVRPAYLNAQPVPRLPPVDACRSQLYLGLVGRHEGAIFIPGLPGRKRVIKPAFQEYENDMFVDGIDPRPPLIEVHDYLPDQVLYAPSINTIEDFTGLGPIDEGRLTIELDVEGYVQEVRCA